MSAAKVYAIDGRLKRQRRTRALVLDEGVPLYVAVGRIRRALKIPEVAEVSGVSVRQIYALIDSGRLPAYRIGGALTLDPFEVSQWLRSVSTNAA